MVFSCDVVTWATGHTHYLSSGSGSMPVVYGWTSLAWWAHFSLLGRVSPGLAWRGDRSHLSAGPPPYTLSQGVPRGQVGAVKPSA
jgi:hypothetical protein